MHPLDLETNPRLHHPTQLGQESIEKPIEQAVPFLNVGMECMINSSSDTCNILATSSPGGKPGDDASSIHSLTGKTAALDLCPAIVVE